MDRPPESKVDAEQNDQIPYGSMAWRLKKYDDKLTANINDGW